MTSGFGTSGVEPVTAPGIHDAPPDPPVAPFTQEQLKARGRAWRLSMLADVLLAVSGIEVPFLGTPFAGLANWAHELQAQASQALSDAGTAQNSANYANAQLLALTNGGLASDVTGGVAISINFNGGAATDWGAGYTRLSEGPGAGGYGPDGSGHAGWTASGGLWRAHHDRPDTPLATDYQAIRALLSTKPQPANGGNAPVNWLRGRCNEDQDTFVWVRIYNGGVELGCRVDGVDTVFDGADEAWSGGDVWILLLGTDDDDREFIVRRNGNEVLRVTDTGDVSAMGPDYRYPGNTANAESSFFVNQTIPGATDVWSAADRLPTTVNI